MKFNLSSVTSVPWTHEFYNRQQLKGSQGTLKTSESILNIKSFLNIVILPELSTIKMALNINVCHVVVWNPLVEYVMCVLLNELRMCYM